jgi:hypothetical protein
MHMAGFFPSVPTQANFELAYVLENRQWRLYGVSVSLAHAGPIAPPPPEPPAAPKGKAPQAHLTPSPAAPNATSEAKQ